MENPVFTVTTEGLPPEAEPLPRGLPASRKIMGIDLGTTFSCVAIMQDDHPKVIPTRKGQRTLPSVVAFDEAGHLLIGEDARRQLLTNPNQTIYGAKRFIGRHFYSEDVSALCRYFPYEIVPLANMQVGARIGAHILSLEQVSALIMHEMRRAVCEYLKEDVYQAVISVPAYYTENQREAVRRAGRIANIDVLRIVNEPTAAALAYGINRAYDKKILVYDLGGGTFDASVLEQFENVFKVLSTGGDTFLGGVDFDERLMNFILNEYESTQGEILQCDSVITQRIKDAAERAKIDLSSKSIAKIDLPYITILKGKFKDFRMDITREDLDILTKDLVDRTLEVCLEVLDEASLMPEQIDSILLVGGQTRMPQVIDKVTRFFGKAPTKGVHPDEVVACGAALVGASLGTNTSVRLIDVLPMSIGARQPDGSLKTLFPTNTPLPADREIGVATTKDKQQAIEIALFQGVSPRAEDNEFLGSFYISGFPPLKAGKVKIAIKLSLNQESLLEVSARSLSHPDDPPLTVRMQAQAQARAGERKEISGAIRLASPPIRKPNSEEDAQPITGIKGFFEKLKV